MLGKIVLVKPSLKCGGRSTVYVTHGSSPRCPRTSFLPGLLSGVLTTTILRASFTCPGELSWQMNSGRHVIVTFRGGLCFRPDICREHLMPPHADGKPPGAISQTMR